MAELHEQVVIVFAAWKRLRQMTSNAGKEEKWSEDDFVMNVYNAFRSQAIQKSIYRAQCKISLPQPHRTSGLDRATEAVLQTNTVIPDVAIMVPRDCLQDMSDSSKSPFMKLKGNKQVKKSGLASFPGFEFVGSYWEDKKPALPALDDAFRQNRMAAASSLRQLHSLNIVAPVFGLMWAQGVVRAHVDWWEADERNRPRILSAPFPGTDEDAHSPARFREWDLRDAGDILHVFFLLRNIDAYITDRLPALVKAGVNGLCQAMISKTGTYRPWRRSGKLNSQSQKENSYANLSSSSVESSAKRNKRKK